MIILLEVFKKILDDEICKRNHNAELLSSILLKSEAIKVPTVLKRNKSAWAQYTIVVNDRDALSSKLLELGIPTAIYYKTPLHKQTAYVSRGIVAESLEVSEKLSETVLSLPMHPYLDELDQDRICDMIASQLLLINK